MFKVNKSIIFLAMLFSLLLIFGCTAQNDSVQIKIVDTAGNPIEGAVLNFSELQKTSVSYSQITNASGSFSEKLPSGNYLLTITKNGFSTISQTIEIKNNSHYKIKLSNQGSASVEIIDDAMQINQIDENKLANNVVLCAVADWKYTLLPNDCPKSEVQLKVWKKIRDCDGGFVPDYNQVSYCQYVQPIVMPAVTCTDFFYSDWSVCSQNYTQTREVLNAVPFGCTGANPLTLKSCTPDCVENWSCGEWLSCSGGLQFRNCSDLGNCKTFVNKPAVSKLCSDVNSCSAEFVNNKNRRCLSNVIQQQWQNSDCSISWKDIYTCKANQICDTNDNGEVYCANQERTCAQIGGSTCDLLTQNCANNDFEIASDNFNCCLSTCVVKTCSEMKGVVCTADQTCAGIKKVSLDSVDCCTNGVCVQNCSPEQLKLSADANISVDVNWNSTYSNITYKTTVDSNAFWMVKYCGANKMTNETDLLVVFFNRTQCNAPLAKISLFDSENTC